MPVRVRAHTGAHARENYSVQGRYPKIMSGGGAGFVGDRLQETQTEGHVIEPNEAKRR